MLMLNMMMTLSALSNCSLTDVLYQAQRGRPRNKAMNYINAISGYFILAVLPELYPGDISQFTNTQNKIIISIIYWNLHAYHRKQKAQILSMLLHARREATRPNSKRRDCFRLVKDIKNATRRTAEV
jgi:hypothetical protein